MSQEENKQNSEETLPNDEEMIEEMVSEEAEEVGSDLERVQMELDQLKDKYTRVHADFDNIKKRLEREKYQALEYAQEKFAKDLIPVVDSLEMAVKAADAEGMEAAELLAKVKEGVELTMKQFLSALEKHGIKAVGEEEPFDPNVHHAVQQVDSPDHESGEIVSTFQKGYKYKERTLRDAMVVIAN
ncbi:nucleotide exchange factor GrpE [Sulfurimonas sp. HSL1-2]|uniref:nucleotide exchange factor GrpE n=1 Tax=Thiomicrolovo zhangzhouensis TaxID=3131933 RepID=UPI0031F7F273